MIRLSRLVCGSCLRTQQSGVRLTGRPPGRAAWLFLSRRSHTGRRQPLMSPDSLPLYLSDSPTPGSHLNTNRKSASPPASCLTRASVDLCLTLFSLCSPIFSVKRSKFPLWCWCCFASLLPVWRERPSVSCRFTVTLLLRLFASAVFVLLHCDCLMVSGENFLFWLTHFLCAVNRAFPFFCER